MGLIVVGVPEDDDDELPEPEDDDEELLDDEEDELLLDEELVEDDDPELEPGSSPPPQPTTNNTVNNGINFPSLNIKDTLSGTSLLFAAKTALYIGAPTQDASVLKFAGVDRVFCSCDLISNLSGIISHWSAYSRMRNNLLNEYLFFGEN